MFKICIRMQLTPASLCSFLYGIKDVSISWGEKANNDIAWNCDLELHRFSVKNLLGLYITKFLTLSLPFFFSVSLLKAVNNFKADFHHRIQ